MTSDEIRERYLSFFEERGHLRIPSASLVPSEHDPSALLTVAGMHPLKPYFLGQETPPAPRLTDCQKVFRAVDIDNVGNSARHLTFFEMLGNFSFGDYFKREAIEFAWQLSREVFGFAAEDIWVTVFEGDDGLGLGPDADAISYWQAVGVPRERIVLCPRSENFWQAGPSGPCGPCSELYIDRGVAHGAPEDLPGQENERFLEYWNLVFMQYDLQSGPGGTSRLTPLPANNIDTGLGLNRLAAILQDKPSVFETDQFWPLIELGEQLSGARYRESFPVDRSLRILADHARAMTFLVADGVVPSNEDRGYVLRRVMRRAIQQGRSLELAPGFLTRYAVRVQELMGGAYPELIEQRQAIEKWLSAEEDSFGRTLAQGLATLRLYIHQAREAGRSTVPAAEVFRLHDTYGFPREMTSELLAAEGLSIEGDVEQLMEAQRERSRAGAAAGASSAQGTRVDSADVRAAASSFAAESGFQTRFTGYETERQRTTVGAVAQSDGRYLVKLAESPFYAAGGGQIADVGTIECEHGDRAGRVPPRRGPGAGGHARGGRAARGRAGARAGGSRGAARHRVQPHGHAPAAGGAARAPRQPRAPGGLLRRARQAALRLQPQPGIERAGADRRRGPRERVDRAQRPGEADHHHTRGGKAPRGDGAVRREVRRGRAHGRGRRGRVFARAVRRHARALDGRDRPVPHPQRDLERRQREADRGGHRPRGGEVAARARPAALRIRPEQAPETVRARERERRELEKELSREGGAGGGAVTIDLQALVAAVANVDGVPVLATTVQAPDAAALLQVVDHLKGKLGDAAIVLGTAVEGRVHLVVSLAPALVERGIKAPAVVKTAAKIVGGGGGGRDTLAQAGGRDPDKLEQAIEAAESEIISALED